ncbi:MAG: hypothetical protein AMK74_04185 [Nitrospira bacterium SM23_35]|nr:MAG: hypothetical protein AMK74_04185 [Nitrospira bacterium SM23_35]
MPAGLKIILYLSFVICLFSLESLLFFGVVFAVLFFSLLFMIPVKFITRGWLPISVLLLFTFWSNLLFRHGKVIFIAGPFMVTADGLTDASVKTMRIVLMIAGAKLLTGTTPIESLTRAFGRFFTPLQRAGVPVNEFVSTMGLTMQSLPALKEQFLGIYRERIQRENIRGFWNRARVIVGFLMPLFVKSMNSPEQIMKQNKRDE